MNEVTWLVRVAAPFSEFSDEVFSKMGVTGKGRSMGDYRMLTLPEGTSPRNGAAAPFVSWAMPMHHAWPCDPRKMDGFIEKAAGGLRRKFAERNPQTVLVGLLEGGVVNPWFKSLASNLRGRVLQLFPGTEMPLAQAGEQVPDRETLFCLIGKEGLFAGCADPLACNGFFPGGRKFLPKSGAESISRAGSKIAEALHQVRLHRPAPLVGTRWLELGASPGGMTAELLNAGYQVTAIDRAPLDKRLDGADGLRFFRGDVADFSPIHGEVFGGLLCDMNGEARVAMREVLRLSRHLQRGGLVIFTLKSAGAEGFRELVALHDAVRAQALAAGLKLVASTHLGGNRREFTWFLERV